MIDTNALKTLSGADLDAIGDAERLPRVTVKGGHGFDEADDSFRRRLLASVIGAAAADAEVPRPEEIETPKDAEESPHGEANTAAETDVGHSDLAASPPQDSHDQGADHAAGHDAASGASDPAAPPAGGDASAPPTVGDAH